MKAAQQGRGGEERDKVRQLLWNVVSSCTVAGVLHKHVRGGGVRLRMLAALVQDSRTLYSGYASVEYVQIRCRSRHQHHGL